MSKAKLGGVSIGRKGTRKGNQSSGPFHPAAGKPAGPLSPRMKREYLISLP